MKLLVIGAGMMGSAAAYDMARSAAVEAVTLADIDKRRAKDAAVRVNRLAGGKKVAFAEIDAARAWRRGQVDERPPGGSILCALFF